MRVSVPFRKFDASSKKYFQLQKQAIKMFFKLDAGKTKKFFKLGRKIRSITTTIYKRRHKTCNEYENITMLNKNGLS